MEVQVIYLMRSINGGKSNTFPYRAYHHHDDAKLNIDILQARDKECSFILDSVKTDAELTNEVYIVTEAKLNHMYPVAAFSNRKQAREFLYADSSAQFKQLQVDCVSLV